MSALTLLVLVAMIALNAGFLATTRRHSNALQLQMSNKPDKQQQKPLKWKTVLGSAMMALSLLDTPAFALNKPLPVVTVKQLEESIDKLEASGSRAETVQTMADLFDAAGSKTLLSRTKYKYVRGVWGVGCGVCYMIYAMCYVLCAVCGSCCLCRLRPPT
ncbi:hypothetical protein B484DRAFT_458867 [Ochromonadaceae sp. CCMP2298]|nr:hypothetical protein B484DRAFT_458867 [Ochromonadaceae sp. CCMP2298]